MTEKILTKNDAMVLLSTQLRDPKLESDLFVKVMTLYSKIAGWDKEKEPSAQEPTIDQLVAAVEKKRKQRV